MRLLRALEDVTVDSAPEQEGGEQEPKPMFNEAFAFVEVGCTSDACDNIIFETLNLCRAGTLP